MAQAPTTYALALECHGFGQGLLQEYHILTLPQKPAPNVHFDTILNHKSLQPHANRWSSHSFITEQTPHRHTPYMPQGPGEALLNPSTATASHQDADPGAGWEGEWQDASLGKNPSLLGIALLPQLSEDGGCQAPPQPCSKGASASLLLQNPMSWCLHPFPFTPST